MLWYILLFVEIPGILLLIYDVIREGQVRLETSADVLTFSHHIFVDFDDFLHIVRLLVSTLLFE